MKSPEKQDQDSRQAYEPPRLDIISLRADEAIASACKELGGQGHNTGGTCDRGVGQFSGMCESLGS